MIPRNAAEAEAAELSDLRGRAEQQRREVGTTLADLVGRLSEAKQPRALARRARRAWLRRIRAAPRALARHPALAGAAAGAAASGAALWWAARRRDRLGAALARAVAPALARAASAAARAGRLPTPRWRR